MCLRNKPNHYTRIYESWAYVLSNYTEQTELYFQVFTNTLSEFQS